MQRTPVELKASRDRAMELLASVSLVGGKVDSSKLTEIRQFMSSEISEDWLKPEAVVPLLSMILEGMGWKLAANGGGVRVYQKDKDTWWGLKRYQVKVTANRRGVVILDLPDQKIHVTQTLPASTVRDAIAAIYRIG